MNPYTAYKTLQARSELLDENNDESLKIYEYFIEFAAIKKNITLLLKEIRKCMNREHRDLDRLKILLKYFPTTPDPSVILNISDYLESIIGLELRNCDKDFEIKLLETIKVFVALSWPDPDGNFEANKNEAILNYLSIWRNPSEYKIQSLLNDILLKLDINEETIIEMRESIDAKVLELTKGYLDQSQNFKAIRIILAKLGKDRCEKYLAEEDIKNIVDMAMDHQLKDEIVSILDTIRNLNIFGMGEIIPVRIKDRIETILGTEKKVLQRPRSAKLKLIDVYYTTEDKSLALRALRKLKLKAGEVNGILRKHILKKNSSQVGYEIQEQIIKNCLYLLRSSS